MLSDKVFVASDLTASITCPACGKIEQKKVCRSIEHETLAKYKHTCRCDNSFYVILERRRSFRKNVRLEGSLIKKSEKFPVLIENISNHGVRVKMSETSALEDGQEITLKFTLDDPEKSIIRKTVRIKKFLSPTDIGCEFLSDTHHQNLEKYFLFS